MNVVCLQRIYTILQLYIRRRKDYCVLYIIATIRCSMTNVILLIFPFLFLFHFICLLLCFFALSSFFLSFTDDNRRQRKKQRCIQFFETHYFFYEVVVTYLILENSFRISLFKYLDSIIFFMCLLKIFFHPIH